MNASVKQLSELLADKNFMLLDKELCVFNPFDVLKLSHHEIRHSNVLAWLFNPTESHDLGTSFFKQFLYHIAKDENDESNFEKQAKIKNLILKIESQKIIDIKVYREYKTDEKRSIDLLLKCKFNSKDEDDLIVFIENKLYSGQSKNQLDDYYKYVSKKLGQTDNSKENIIPVYLTLDEDDAPKGEYKSEYFHLTYYDIHEILENIIAIKNFAKDNLYSFYFLKQYKKTLEEFLNMNEETELAKTIYKNHKEAIDFIIKNSASPLLEAGNKFLEAHKDAKLSSFKRSNSTFFAFCDEILKNTHEGKEKDWREGAICGYFFALSLNADDLGGKLNFFIEVGPFLEPEKRKIFTNILKEQGGFKEIKTNTYSKIYTGVQKIENTSNEDELYDAMNELFDKKETQNAIQKLHECVEEYEKNI